VNDVIDCYLWMNSDWAYLGADRLVDLASRQAVAVRYLPIDLPAVYGRTGGVLLSLRAPERQAYRKAELQRWCRRIGVHVNTTPRFMCPDAGLASRIVIAADCRALPVAALYKAILQAEWCDDQDISDPETLRRLLLARGLPADELLRLADSAAVRDSYQRYTEDAIRAGVFGSPSYVWQGELFWGQDRLDFLEEAVLASRTTPARSKPSEHLSIPRA